MTKKAISLKAHELKWKMAQCHLKLRENRLAVSVVTCAPKFNVPLSVNDGIIDELCLFFFLLVTPLTQLESIDARQRTAEIHTCLGQLYHRQGAVK